MISSLKLYQTMVKTVTDANNLAAQLRDEKLSKEDAVVRFQQILAAAGQAIAD